MSTPLVTKARCAALATAATLLVVLAADVCWGHARARASLLKVSAKTFTRADAATCSDAQSAWGNPQTANSVCASFGARGSTARARAHAANAGLFGRSVSAHASGSGHFYRAGKADQDFNILVSASDTLDVQMTTVGTDWQVVMFGDLSNISGAGEYAGGDIFVAIYPDSIVEAADTALDGTGALYAWKAQFANGTLTLPTLAVPNRFSAGDFSIVGNQATLNKTDTVPIGGASDSLATLAADLGTGGGDIVDIQTPAMTPWGLALLGTVLLAFGAILLLRRRHFLPGA